MVRHVHVWFGHSYIVPLPKSKDYVSKPLSCEDFRGIAISFVIAKVFEYCFLQKFGDYLYTDSKQFGMGCNHAINTVRCVIEQLTKAGNTVNLCAIDFSKAFDKVNHY